MAEKGKHIAGKRLPEEANMPLIQFLKEKHIVIVCGSGGVGKTTVAASLALKAAEEGKKVLVLTIDPAKRLANSLGVTELGNKEVQVDAQHLDKSGITLKGELWAMMLDMKRSFDMLIEKYSPNEETTERILQNKFYMNMSSALVGTHEYMAMEKLYDLAHNRNYDLIVLDTPPTKHALDFLQAPANIIDFFDSGVFQWLLGPSLAVGKRAFFSFTWGAGVILKVLQVFVGKTFIEDLVDFLKNFEQMAEDFSNRAKEVRNVLRQKDTVFLLVTAPGELSLEESYFFYEVLSEEEMPFGGFIINRVHPKYFQSSNEEEAETALDPLLKQAYDYGVDIPSEIRPIIPKVIKNFQDYQYLANQDAAEIERFRNKTHNDYPFYLIDYLDFDVYDIKGLAAINQNLFK